MGPDYVPGGCEVPNLPVRPLVDHDPQADWGSARFGEAEMVVLREAHHGARVEEMHVGFAGN